MGSVPASQHDLSHDSKIIIVGGGVFGLSTALHLSKRGYTNIHIFDSQPFDQNHYNISDGAFSASCDENKVIRASYGGETLYQDLAFEAMPEWDKWNAELARSSPSDLPPTLDPKTPLWHNCGFLRLTDHGLEQSEIDTQKNFPPDTAHTQYRISSPERRREAAKQGIPATKLDPFHLTARDIPVDGILDTTAGFVLASRACTWALHLLRQTGHATFHFGPAHALHTLLRDGDRRITGILTRSSATHSADAVILATGGWTPALLPSTADLLETTAGSVVNVTIPRDRSELIAKYSADAFPVWSWNYTGYRAPTAHDQDALLAADVGGVAPGERLGGIYGFPLAPASPGTRSGEKDTAGVVKFAFRGAKWTSFTRAVAAAGEADGGRPGATADADAEAEAEADAAASHRISYPDPSFTAMPAIAVRILRAFAERHFADLLALPEECVQFRMCWYTDSVDNSFLIDRVPGVAAGNLIVASGGSGHGFKFLPTLGAHVVDALEGRTTRYSAMFRWRESGKGVEGKKRNGLEEGEGGWRDLKRHRLVGKEVWGKGD